jgi:MFS family permease
MLMCAVATVIGTLSVGRLITGIGVGALIPSCAALTAEYANHRYRDFSVILFAIGFPVGGLVGGGISSVLLHHFNWRAIFAAGGIATVLMMIAPIWLVPESIEYLFVRRPANALQRVNTILSRLKQSAVTSLPAMAVDQKKASALDIFSQPALLLITLMVTLSYGSHNATLYYALNWIPKLVVDLSLTQSEGAAVAAYCSGGGVLGALVVAWLSTRFDVRVLTAVLLLGTSASLWAYARIPDGFTSLSAVAAILGACLYGGQASLYALMTKSFPVHARATGVGFVTGIGRVGGVLSPLISGYLLGIGLRNVQVSSIMALGSLSGAVILLLLTTLLWRRSQDTVVYNSG